MGPELDGDKSIFPRLMRFCDFTLENSFLEQNLTESNMSRRCFRRKETKVEINANCSNLYG